MPRCSRLPAVRPHGARPSTAAAHGGQGLGGLMGCVAAGQPVGGQRYRLLSGVDRGEDLGTEPSARPSGHPGGMCEFLEGLLAQPCLPLVVTSRPVLSRRRREGLGWLLVDAAGGRPSCPSATSSFPMMPDRQPPPRRARARARQGSTTRNGAGCERQRVAADQSLLDKGGDGGLAEPGRRVPNTSRPGAAGPPSTPARAALARRFSGVRGWTIIQTRARTTTVDSGTSTLMGPTLGNREHPVPGLRGAAMNLARMSRLPGCAVTRPAQSRGTRPNQGRPEPRVTLAGRRRRAARSCGGSRSAPLPPARSYRPLARP